MMKRALVIVIAGGSTLAAAAPFMAVTVVLGVVAGQPPAPAPASSAPLTGGSRLAAIPSPMLRLYVDAASTCAGLPWTVLAAIGTVESDNGQSVLPGVHSGHNYAGAEGPMQFEPATFAIYDRPVPPGGANPPSPYDPTDAVFAAARMLCADGIGGAGGASAGGSPAGPTVAQLRRAVLAYNHSTAYADQVLALARTLAADATAAAGSTAAAATAVGATAVGATATGVLTRGAVAMAYAVAQVGTPYRWGGETAGVGFDCSGLAQAAWAAAGVSIPRVAEQQFRAALPLPPLQPLQPGDLVFFAAPAGVVAHVGLYVGAWRGQALMVDAPHAGAAVRVEPFPTTLGAVWGGEVFAGATDPSG